MDNGGQYAVLIVDDDESARELIRRRLESDYSIIEAENGLEAIEAFERHEIDLVVMDVMMPRVSGIEACCELKARTADEFLPIILLTALNSQEDRNLGLQAGADDFLSKPVDWRELKLRVRALLRLREQERTIRAYSEELETIVAERTASLKHQVRLTEQIVDSLPVSLHVIDRNRKIVAWNRSRERGPYGVQRKEVLGRDLYDVIPIEDREEHNALLATIFETGEGTEEQRESTVDGETRQFHMRRVPMRLTSDEVTHVITIGEDVTEAHRMRNSLRVTDKMAAMGRLAAGVAHEVNNPLAIIVGCAESLKRRLANLAPEGDGAQIFEEYLETIRDEAFRAKNISQDLLDFGRTKTVERETADLGRIVERALQVMKHHYDFKRVRLECEMDDRVLDAIVEEDAIVQVLVALMINALDAMPDGGVLSVITGAGDAEVWFAVEDSGEGISRRDLPHIFEPFFTTKPVGRGTGLGLSICYGIVQSHGGRMEVDSKPGRGSRFTVVLPATGRPADSDDPVAETETMVTIE